jgi:hypothetical protein
MWSTWAPSRRPMSWRYLLPAAPLHAPHLNHLKHCQNIGFRTGKGLRFAELSNPSLGVVCERQDLSVSGFSFSTNAYLASQRRQLEPRLRVLFIVGRKGAEGVTLAIRQNAWVPYKLVKYISFPSCGEVCAQGCSA